MLRNCLRVWFQCIQRCNNRTSFWKIDMIGSFHLLIFNLYFFIQWILWVDMHVIWKPFDVMHWSWVTVLDNLVLFFFFAEETLGRNVVCGIIAGVVSSSIANPTDVLKVSILLQIIRKVLKQIHVNILYVLFRNQSHFASVLSLYNFLTKSHENVVICSKESY